MKQKVLILLAMTLLPLSMLAQYDDDTFTMPIGDLNYVFNKSTQTATVIGFNGTGVSELVIPSTVTTSSGTLGEFEEEITYTVTEIGEGAFLQKKFITTVKLGAYVVSIDDFAFSNCSGITSVTMGSNLRTIGKQAFAYCYNLSSVTVNNLLTIGDLAFVGCSSLTAFNFPSTVTSIGIGAFQDCKSLESISIPGNVTTLSASVFSDCTSLSSVTFPNTLTTIGSQAFARCIALTNSAIPESVTTIGDFAFKGCTGFTTLTIPNNVVSIGSSAYGSCSAITDITIGTSVTTIGENAFEGCKGITAINIPNNITTLGETCFGYCESLTTVTIGTGVTDIKTTGYSYEESPFYNCPNLTNITVAAGNSTYDSRENCNAIIETSSNKLLAGSKNAFIPEGVKAIADNAFYNISGLTTIIIPLSVQSVGHNAFEGTGLTLVNIDSKSTTIPDDAFTGVGSQDSPCTLYAPVFYDFGTDTSGNYFDWKGGCFGLGGVTIALEETTMGTFYSSNPVDFSDTEDLKAYILVGVNTDEKYVTIVPVKDAPANTGLLLIGKPGVYPVPYGPSPSRYANMLKGTSVDYALPQSFTGNIDMVFDSETMKFRFPNDGEVLEAGKAYLPIEMFGGDELSIKAVVDDSLKGDVNDDGTVNVSDVTKLVDIILHQ